MEHERTAKNETVASLLFVLLDSASVGRTRSCDLSYENNRVCQQANVFLTPAAVICSRD